jgi:hypothetical protein
VIVTATPAVSFERLSLAAVLAAVEPQPAPCLSLYLPTHRNVPDNTVDRPAFHHLVESLELALQSSVPRERIERLLHPFRVLESDREFWQHTCDGLAVLAADGQARVFALQRPVPPLAVVGPRFHTAPLVRLAAAAERFHLLLLTSREARLCAGSCWVDPRGATVGRLDPVPLAPRTGAPARTTLTRDDVVDEESFQPHRVQRGMGIEGIIHGGTGAKRDDVEDDTAIFLAYVAAIVHEQASQPTGLPLFLIAQPRLAATYRGLAKDPHLAADHVAKDPHLMTEDDILAAVTPLFVAARGRQVARLVHGYEQARDRGLAQGDLSDVARAAVAGKVATLLIEADRFEAGRFDRDSGAIEFAPATSAAAAPIDRSRTGDLPAEVAEDLFGAVAETVLLHGGTVVALARNEMPTESGVAAIDRYA